MSIGFHGSTCAMARVSMLAAAVLFMSAATARSFAASADPSADEVLDAAVKALGGQEAIDRIKTLRTVATMNVQGMEMQMETCWSRAGGRMTRTHVPSGGSLTDVIVASDGTIGWMKGPTGYQLLTAEQTDDLKQQAGMFMNLLDLKTWARESIKTVENAGKHTFAAKDCWRLHYTRSDGDEGDIFFDAASNLPAGLEHVAKRDAKEVRSRAVVSDWRPDDGVQFFRSVRIESSAQPDNAVEMTVKTIEVNKLDEQIFTAPEEVKALASKAPATTAAAASAPASRTASSPAEVSLDDMTPQQRETAARALEGFKKSGDVNAMKQILLRVQSVIDMIPENERLPMKYALQELRKEIARLGG